MRFATSTDGIPLAYDSHGTAVHNLVLVHGWSCDRSYWQGQVTELSQSFQVVTIDLAGHGESRFGRKEWTIESFGEDVATVVSELGLEKIVLVGHSMGGDVILEAARRLPSRVAGLVWLDVYSSLERFRTPAQVQEMLAPFRRDFAETMRDFIRSKFHPTADPQLVERVVEDMASAPPEVSLGSAASAWGFGARAVELLRELHLPLVAINPENPPTDIESMRRHGVEVILVPEVGHFLMMEGPQRLNRLLTEAVGCILRRR